MLSTIRTLLNSFLLGLETFGTEKVPVGFRQTYEVVVSFILIVLGLAGIFSVLSFLSVANLLVLSVIIVILGGGVWVAKHFGDSDE